MTTLFGIKNCDTVRKATKWLQSEDIEFTFHDFRKDGLSPDVIDNWLNQLGANVLVNKRSTTWKSLSESEKAKFDDTEQLKQLIAENPTLVKRPVLIHKSAYYVGFKEAEYQSIFKS